MDVYGLAHMEVDVLGSHNVSVHVSENVIIADVCVDSAHEFRFPGPLSVTSIGKATQSSRVKLTFWRL